MSSRSPRPSQQRQNPSWDANHFAVRAETMTTPGGLSAVVGLQHLGYPFTGVVAANDLQAQLQHLGNDYLDRVSGVVGISGGILAVLRHDDRPEFGWIRLSWGDGETGAARALNGSYTVARRTPAGQAIDRTVILLAGYRMPDRTSWGGEIGLRVVMHLVEIGPNAFGVRITGLTLSNLPTTLKRTSVLAQPPGLQISLVVLRKLLRLYHNVDELSVQGMVPDHPDRPRALRIFGDARTRSNQVFAFVTEISAPGPRIVNLASLDLVSAAGPTAFASDPQSCSPADEFSPRRPVRAHERLDPFRAKTTRLVSPLHKAGLFEVRQTPLGQFLGNNDPRQVQAVDITRLPLRADALSAAHAFLRADELMQRFTAYSLPVADYFKMAKLPLVLRHHAPIRGARDGNTVNAQVRPDDVGLSLTEQSGPKTGADPRPQIEVSFGAANLRRRGLVNVTPSRSRLQPAGLAADRRWAWHEFCHVLNYASFGKLEFRFAHSAGDALAAIVADPDSSLARRPLPFARHITFPWVAMGRRHDRDPMRGWACCGRRNLARLASSTAFDNQRRGYFEEQLLSSALFRFYRAIGGDCATTDERRAASDYAVYLIFRAIEMLGQTTPPTRTIEGFVNELMQADTATGAWDVIASWPENVAPRTLHRIGGCVHKVMRWAFERQGLYATDDPLKTVEGVGKPPAVDIFIANARPRDHGAPPPEDGGYWPVPLRWSKTDQPWHASDAGIKLRAGRLVVTVRNRGAQPAQAVSVVCWLWPAATAPAPAPTFTSAWVATAAPSQNVPPGAAVDFEFAPGVPLTGAKRYFVFAVATCAADRANLDPASGQPCASIDTPLLDLVANDNNLGLRILPI